MNNKFIPIMLCALFTATPSISKPMMYGVPECGSWIKGSGITERPWLAGYLSGMIAGLGVDVLRDVSFESAELWMDKYCRDNPLENLNRGANALVNELISRKEVTK